MSRTAQTALARRIALALLAPACAAPPSSVPSDAAPADSAADTNVGDSACTGVSCGGECCVTGEVCAASGCAPPCDDGDNCDGDRCCAGGACEPFGDTGCGDRDESCAVLSGGFGAPDLELVCAWDEEDAVSQPIAGDLDRDGTAEVVFHSRSPAGGEIVTLRVVRGDDCALLWSGRDDGLRYVTPAIGDIDGDPDLEVVVVEDWLVHAYDADGSSLAWSAERPNQTPSRVPLGLGVADLDGEPPAEIFTAFLVLRYDGAETLETVWEAPGQFASVAVAADVDLDGAVELVSGQRIYDAATGVEKTPYDVLSQDEGFVALADFDPATPEPEIAIVAQPDQEDTLRIQRLDGSVIFGPVDPPGGPGVTGAGSAPAVADFDGDGRPEAAVAWEDESLAMYDLDCSGWPPGCEADGLRWSRATTDWSGYAGPAAYDFDGDGAADVAYRDECWLRIYDGRSGTTIAAAPATSVTLYEHPVVADVDGDGATEIVVTTDARMEDIDAPWPGCDADTDLGLPHEWVQGLRIYREPTDAWVPARGIWNQHAYAITNVNDDGTIPSPEPPSWQVHNTFRAQAPAPSAYVPGADLTVGAGGFACDDGAATIEVVVWNRGAAAAPAGVAVDFWAGDPAAGGEKICTSATTRALAPGEGETVACTWADPPGEPVDVYVIADGDEQSPGDVRECHERNNTLVLRGVACGGAPI